MNRDNYIYPAVFDYAEDGISISFPDLPGCLSCAQTDEEAYFMARDAMRGWLLVAEEYGDEIAAPTALKDILPEPNRRAVLIDVNLAFYREPYKNRAVKKTLTIPAWLNDIAEREHVNFSSVLQTALKQQLNV